MTNPLIDTTPTPFNTPAFSQIKNEHFKPAIRRLIAEAKKEIADIVQNGNQADFENTIETLEKSGKALDRVSSIFFNLNSAETNDELQAIAKEISPLLTAFSNDILLDKKLFEKIAFVFENTSHDSLTPEQRTLLEKTHKSFVRNGALLNSKQQQTLRKIDIELARLSLEFGEHVLAETNKFELIIEQEEDLNGLPAFAREQAAETARNKGYEDAWVFTLDYPSYVPFVTYAGNRNLRKQISTAFASRAFKGNSLDNQEIVKKIVQLRNQRARLLGYRTHADFVLEERMAKSPEKVMTFLSEIEKYGKEAALRDVRAVAEFAQKLDGIDRLEKWDFAYYSEKLKMEKYAIDDEILKPYFPLEKVVQGAFETAGKLFGLVFLERKDIDTYHEEVVTYEVKDDSGKHIAIFYTDFFPRPGKRAGAWMTSFAGQYKDSDGDHRPLVSIVCNFTKPMATTPSLLTFNEVTTLFHEFGHALHGMLADGQYETLSGTNVYWDFVELPSQIMENWCYEKECLDPFARHYETGEAIPEELIEKIKASANFMEGYQTMRQLSLGMLDMAWHSIDNADVEDVGGFERNIMAATDVLPSVPDTNISCSFSHIFQGGYSAGYYSYKWAEVLDADAFEYFQQNGIFNKEIARRFRKYILSSGGSEHPMELYKKFRRKEPEVKPLLKRAGLIDDALPVAFPKGKA